jgi:hypothetical protein
LTIVLESVFSPQEIEPVDIGHFHV